MSRNSQVVFLVQIPSKNEILGTLDTTDGTVKTSHTRGIVTATVKEEGNVSASNHSGDFDARTKRGRASIVDSEGTARAHSDKGEAIVQRMTDAVYVKASTRVGDVQVRDVQSKQVNTWATSGRVTLTGVDAKKINANVYDGGMVLDRVKGAITATINKGDLTASNTTPIGQSRFENKYGTTTVTTPSGFHRGDSVIDNGLLGI